MKKIITIIVGLIMLGQLSAQNVGIGTTTPHTSAKLDVQSQNSGVLLPRMSSAQRKAIAAPAVGLLVFDTDKNAFMFWSGNNWQMLAPVNGSQGQTSEVTPPVNPNVNNFGYRVAISGNFAAIGAYDNASRRVYVYEKNGAGWVQRQEIISPDAGNRMFGDALDMDGDYLIIGDRGWRNAANVAVGKVFVYRRSNGSYMLDAGIASINTTADDFGRSVAISEAAPGGLTIAVGMPGATAALPTRANAGRVILYKKTASSWVLAQNILPANVEANDNAGWAVDLEGGVLAFGAPGYGDNRGRLYIYEYQPGNSLWQQSVVQAGATGGLLGYSVSVSGTAVAGGKPNSVTGESGGILLYIKDIDNTWASMYIYEPPGLKSRESFNTFFGYSVKLQDDYLLVGAPGTFLSYPGGSKYGYESGKALLYKLRFLAYTVNASLQWVKEATYNSVENYYATSVGLSAGNFIIGHQHASDYTSNIKGAVIFGSYGE